MYKKLQNGSDIRGKAISTDEGEATLTPQAVRAIGAGFVRFLREDRGLCDKPTLTIAVGHDSRITGERMFLDFAAGLLSADDTIDIVYTRLSSTPAMFMSTIMPAHMYDAGVMITASHLPYDRNGLKFFLKDGGLEKRDIARILEYAADCTDMRETPLRFRCVDIMSDYSAALRRVITDESGISDKPLDGLHVIVDAGNGAGGFFAKQVLEPLGADISGNLYQNPDGMFPNHVPNPEDESATIGISRAVAESDADLGIIFDTDVDRAAVVFSDGNLVNRNRLIALMSAIVLEKHPGTTIVTDSVTSTGLGSFIRKLGGRHRRFKRGYKNVINEAQRLNASGEESYLAIETSGHGAMRDNYFLDDGAYMACIILSAAARMRCDNRALPELIADLDEPAEGLEVRIKITAEDYVAYGNDVLTALSRELSSWQGCTVEPDNCEGIRANFDADNGDGWFLLRMSLHDPVLPLNIESDSIGGCAKIFQVLRAFFQKFSMLEL